MAIQDEWDQILDQGYLEFQGFNPNAGYQAEAYHAGYGGWTPGATGGEGFFRAPNRQRIPIKNEQDLLDYLKWSASLGVFNRQRRGRLGIGGATYTGDDIYEYFQRPGEERGFRDQAVRSKAAWDKAQTISGALASQFGSRLGLGGGAQGEYLRQAGQAGGGAQAERALAEGMGRYAKAVTEDESRLATQAGLTSANLLGHGQQAEEQETVAGIAQTVGDIGLAAGAGSMNPYGALAGAIVKAGSVIPEQIARDQGRRHRLAGQQFATRMGDVSATPWSVPQTGLLRGSQAIDATRYGGSSEQALRNLYSDEEDERLFQSALT
jgi:hypothetical protein